MVVESGKDKFYVAVYEDPKRNKEKKKKKPPVLLIPKMFQNLGKSLSSLTFFSLWIKT